MGYPTGGAPLGVYDGTRAETSQSYDEANKKNGSQWGASRRILSATNGGKYYSLLKTRTLPLDLKQRVFSYTGKGIIARFYTGFSALTLPAPEPVYCLRPGKPAFRDFDLYAIATAPASLGVPWSFNIILEGNAQNQGKGVASAVGGYGWVIDPGEEVLMEIESLDAQNISATLAMYNGILDLPLPSV